jgi:hypothetical protein
LSYNPVQYFANSHATEPKDRPKVAVAGIVQWIDSKCSRCTSLLLAGLVGLVVIYMVQDYSRYYDWPSFNGAAHVREYVPASYPVANAHYYQYDNIVDTWELYRFNTSPEAVAKLAENLRLSSQGTVSNFALIVSRPPPNWWHPEQLASAELFAALERGPDGMNYELLYAADTGTVYMIRFDG